MGNTGAEYRFLTENGQRSCPIKLSLRELMGIVPPASSGPLLGSPTKLVLVVKLVTFGYFYHIHEMVARNGGEGLMMA